MTRFIVNLKHLLLLFVVVFCLTNAQQNLKKTTCPICGMTVKAHLRGDIAGHQGIYACEMAGHLDSLVHEPKKNLAEPIKASPADDPIYKNAKEMDCPVCKKAFEELKYAVPWAPDGDQKIFTCSEQHAQQVFSDPTAYFLSNKNDTSVFCQENKASVMFNGFQVAIGRKQSCALLLFQPWIISSAVKYAFSFISVVLLAISLEGIAKVREYVEKKFYLENSKVSSTQTSYLEFDTPTNYFSARSKDASSDLAGKDSKVKIIRSIPFWCRVLLATLYMIAISVAYFLMLIIMMYETSYFIAVILGLGLGFFLFKDTEADKMSGNVDPCCST